MENLASAKCHLQHVYIEAYFCFQLGQHYLVKPGLEAYFPSMLSQVVQQGMAANSFLLFFPGIPGKSCAHALSTMQVFRTTWLPLSNYCSWAVSSTGGRCELRTAKGK